MVLLHHRKMVVLVVGGKKNENYCIVTQLDLTHLKRCPWIFAYGSPNKGLNKSDNEL